MNGPTQTRWHVLTECADVHLIEPRRKAAEWLSNKLNQFGREAQWTLAAISGAGNQLQPEQRMAALRFLLGLPNVVIPDCRDGESKLAQGYGKGFLKWIAVIIRTAGSTAQAARTGPERPAVQFRWLQTEGCAKWTSTRTRWMAMRGWREVHEGAALVRTCFRALRTWAAAAGPTALQQHQSARNIPKGGAGSFFTPMPDETRCGNAAYDEWSTLIAQRAVAPCFATWATLVAPRRSRLPPRTPADRALRSIERPSAECAHGGCGYATPGMTRISPGGRTRQTRRRATPRNMRERKSETLAT